MRVIEIGNMAEREIECGECHTILAYTDADIQETERKTYQYVECPMCGEKLVIPCTEN